MILCCDVDAPESCCVSCHEDEWEGYCALPGYGDEPYFHVCCAVAGWLEKHPERAEEIVWERANAPKGGQTWR